MSVINGQLPDSALAPIAQGRLSKPAAAAWNAMNIEARKRGTELLPTGSASSYRTLEQQKALYAKYLAGGTLAARPGTSNHGLGLAVDVPTRAMRDMIDTIGEVYGWSKRWSDAPTEWWHIKYEAGHWKGTDPGPYGKGVSSSMVTMYDSIDLSQFPSNPEAVAGYVGGRWPTYNDLVKKFPNAHHLSVAVTAQQRARCLDIEPGDASVAQALGWFRNMADRTHGKPVFYTSASNVANLIGTMTASRVSRNDYLIWSAHYTFKEHICGHGCGYPQVDATQWTDKAQGRNLDQSLCSPQFFGTGSSLPPLPEGTMAIAVHTNENNHTEVFVHLESGEVKNLYKTDNKDQGGPGWKKTKDGKFAWESLGNPGK